MRILVFGATGGTGKQVISQGLEQGYAMTAFVRNPALLATNHKKLAIIQGNILHAKEVTDAIQGHDGIISTLGNKTSTAFWQASTIISDGLKNIVQGMHTNRVKRLIFVTSFGVVSEIFLPQKVFIKVVLKNIFADIPLQEKIIKESGLDWTIVRPGRLTAGEKIGKYTVGEHIPIGVFSHISRADVADFLLKNVTTTKYMHTSVTIRY